VLDQTKGQLAQKEARWRTAKAALDRIRPLAAQNAISQKDLDDSIGMEQSTRADVLSAKASVERAQLELGFTKIMSPIDGIAGIANAQIGDLVGTPGSPELTTVSALDPIRVYVAVSEQEYMQRAQDKDAGKEPSAELQLFLADGALYPHRGTFGFADRQVDVKTGTIRVATLFPNPGNVLRPGQYAKVRAVTKSGGALLVPQRAVTELQGRYQVAVVGPDNKVELRPVKVGDRVESLWIIREGLKAGERVVAEGVQKVKDGMVVSPKPVSPGKK
jgi:membrane fusion protein (multidrug efflux system)